MKKAAIIVFVLIHSLCYSQSADQSDSISKFNKIRVIPNPTSEIIFIRNGDEVNSYQLFNMQGQKVQESKTGIQVISLLNEDSGYYFLILEIQGAYKTYRIQKH